MNPEHSSSHQAGADRRAFLSTAGKFAVVIPPTMSLLLSTTLTSPAIAASGASVTKGNNGLGNGLDPQPPGSPPPNDTPDRVLNRRRGKSGG